MKKRINSGSGSTPKKHKLKNVKSMVRLAVHHNKGVTNFKRHDMTKIVLDDKVKQRQHQSKARLAKRLRNAKANLIKKKNQNRTTVMPKEAKKKTNTTKQADDIELTQPSRSGGGVSSENNNNTTVEETQQETPVHTAE